MEAIWTKVEEQLRILRRISELLNDELAQSQLNLLQILQGKLLETISKLEIPTSEGSSFKRKMSERFRKLKFVVVKSSLDKLVAELEAWQNRFDPTWYLNILIGSSVLDSALLESRQHQATRSDQKLNPLDNMLALRSALKQGTGMRDEARPKVSLNLSFAGLSGAEETNIPFSPARTILRVGSTRLLIAEAVDSPPETVSQVKADVENLARKLQQIDPDTFGLLSCYGLLKHRDPATNRLTAIEAIYRAPMGSKPPTTLRQHLLKQNAVSLSSITRIAKQLVRSVSYIHACDFVHKNIRPENILVFSTDESPLGSSFLLGFNQFRNTNFQTNLSGDSAWHRNLYRHPQRQGAFVQERYMMQHDIYSLGVCLLEIGLWRSFVWYPVDSSNAAPVPALPLGLSICDRDFETIHSSTLLQIKEHLVVLAKKELPPRFGDIYTDIVLACLTCLDAGNETFGSEQELRDEDGIIVGVRFIEKILTRLSEILI